MKRLSRLAAAMLLLVMSPGPGWSAEPLSDDTLEEITAQGHNDASHEPFHEAATEGVFSTTVSIHDMHRSSVLLQGQAQSNLKGLSVNNAAGRNQIANGINLR